MPYLGVIRQQKQIFQSTFLGTQHLPVFIVRDDVSKQSLVNLPFVIIEAKQLLSTGAEQGILLASHFFPNDNMPFRRFFYPENYSLSVWYLSCPRVRTAYSIQLSIRKVISNLVAELS